MTNITLLPPYISFTILTIIMIMILTKFIHPALTIITMLLYNIMLCMNMSMWKPSFIYSMLFFLIMISGLLIIFLYFSSLISNEKSLTSPKLMMNFLTITIIMTTPLLMSLPHTFNPPYYGTPPIDKELLTNLIQMTWKPMTLMYTNLSSHLTMISMMYLLIMLMSIIKIITPKIKSMRKME